MNKHHIRCFINQAWDVENVLCTCPKYWPRKEKHPLPPLTWPEAKKEIARMKKEGK